LRFQSVMLLCVFVGWNAWAQGPGRGAPPVKSPEVSPDGRVTFRLRAPEASQVAVAGIGQRLAMQKDDQGVWSATTDPLKPDIYTYSFSVDGATVSDPRNPYFKSSYGSAGQSLVYVLGSGPSVWAPAEGPRGTVAHHFYKSAIIGDNRDFYVYTPPGYDAKRKEPYPVLFLLHGLGDDAAAWTNVGAANVILDNLINQGAAKPMVMVNTLGYGTSDGPAGAMGASMIPTFTRALIEEVLPQVERTYHVSHDRAQRAIAGLSMGGAESLYAGLHNTDRFAYIGSFSGAFVMWPRANPPSANPPSASPPSGGGRGGRGQPMRDADFDMNFPDLTAKSASRLRLVWIACGLDDGLNTVNRQLKTWLKSKDIEFTDIEVPGYAHVWPLWRENLAALAPLLFQSGWKSEK
jgi:enterochelin esterase-like enzyme